MERRNKEKSINDEGPLIGMGLKQMLIIEFNKQCQML